MIGVGSFSWLIITWFQILIIRIQLNSFVHRVFNTEDVKEIIKAKKFTIKIIKRSRNWAISGTAEQIEDVIIAIDNYASRKEPKVKWINDAITSAIKDPEKQIAVAKTKNIPEKLKPITYLTENPSITVTQLAYIADCTLSEARKAIDEYEFGGG